MLEGLPSRANLVIGDLLSEVHRRPADRSVRPTALAWSKFVELHVTNKSSIAGTALELFGQLYQVERDIHGLADATRRLEHRQTRAGLVARALHDWMTAQRGRVPPGTATTKALDCSLNRWAALTRYLDDARLPIDNNHDEQQIRPWPTGRKNWLFAGTLAAGRRAAAITSLSSLMRLRSARLACGLAPASSGSARAVVQLARHLSNSAGYTPCPRHQALLPASFIAAFMITASSRAHPRANLDGTCQCNPKSNQR